jgi:hypothetical protein
LRSAALDEHVCREVREESPAGHCIGATLAFSGANRLQWPFTIQFQSQIKSNSSAEFI